jgi:sterol desaturase/sphingolipid hydroxylase (fatty acid hydroxylase superfamily)
MTAAAPTAVETLSPETTAALPRTLRDAANLFWRCRTPWIILSVIVVTATGRLTSGALTWLDLVIVGGMIAFQPFQEWVIHVGILHWRPKTVAGLTIDTEIAKRHRQHHENPSDLPKIFMPVRAILTSIVINVLLFLAILPAPHYVFTALFTASMIGMIYEWTHFLIHTSYAPKTFLYRKLWRFHRLHHYKNEHFWFGVTMHLGDKVLGTDPDPKQVPVSPTARKLLGTA